SPCLHGTPDADGLVAWQPLRRTEPPDFSGLAAALERPLPAAWEAYFGRYWSETLPTGGLYGRVELLQLWNPEDQERLVANQLGHVLQRRRRGQSPSLFFACADDPDQLYSVDLDSGAVLREQLSRGTQRELAASLADFLAGLKALAGD
ncbi:MAG TPA: SecY-interacting protein Syd, partial [Gammaproteobacteria bacterium]